MKAYLTAATLGLLITGPAFAQSSTTPAPKAPEAQQQNSFASQTGNMLTAQKLKQDLQNAGFTDVTVAAEAFLVQAKTKDGNPVVMTIGPHGFTAMEAVHTTGSTGSMGNTGSSGSSGSMNSTNPSTQK
ncbi:hypothetical protein [Microvirga massiliensis]|uniref:hypothetical protein n=1 Tax=Microvirga massiliensis TaxID=1033741 RepID=UPI0006606AC9|nr:hypothetical protein [Microvirga massiliensis]